MLNFSNHDIKVVVPWRETEKMGSGIQSVKPSRSQDILTTNTKRHNDPAAPNAANDYQLVAGWHLHPQTASVAKATNLVVDLLVGVNNSIKGLGKGYHLPAVSGIHSNFQFLNTWCELQLPTL